MELFVAVGKAINEMPDDFEIKSLIYYRDMCRWL